ncbi:MAG TPA: phytoene/squalene synthase family protein [Polyangia bacterium]|jgi:phytoene synthase|nr:phytoene/squalene synthase family protein [Polyangia bacterium]
MTAALVPRDGALAARQVMARQILATHSKSFWWASLLLPEGCRRDAAALYAWCRRCDDAADLPQDPEVARRAVTRLRAELDAVYRGEQLADPVLVGFAEVIHRHQIPYQHPSDLIDGMAMDLGPVRYQTFEQLVPYCYRVAGTVGLMMAHLMGVRDAATLSHASDLGIAMQLTNICRDVVEDAGRDRVYVPQELCGTEGPTTDAVAELLRRAESYYRSGERGLPALPWRCAVAVRAARLIYGDIGVQLARRGFDFRAGRVVVPRRRKLWLALRALAAIPGDLWRRLRVRSRR